MNTKAANDVILSWDRPAVRGKNRNQPATDHGTSPKNFHTLP